MSVFSRLRSLYRRAHARKTGAGRSIRLRPALECLEDRTTPSTVSSITASFNGTAIPAGSTIWFNGAFTATGLAKAAPTTIHVDNGGINFTAGGTPYHIAVPNGVIVLTPGATQASATFDPTDNDWDVSAPSGGAGDVFMGGVAVPVTTRLPGGIKNLTWSGAFWSDAAGVTVNWKWAAAVYKSFSGDYNALKVKAVDNKDMTAYHNGDQSGAPEAFKSFVTSGGTGGGGSHYTGNFTGAKAVKPTLGDGLQDYPFASSNPLTSVAFNESTILRAANLDVVNGAFQLWYNDEHAMALGVRQVVVKTSSGTTVTDYPVSPLTSNPGSAFDADVGSTDSAGDKAGTDLSGRPMFPSLFITDTTTNPNSRSGDWQSGGTALPPSAVFGTWKGVVRTVDRTTATPTVTVTCDADPVKNNWNLGPGSDAPPAGLTNEGYGAEARWSLSDLQSQHLLVPGHSYRFYVIVHDGDQNKSGGDCGQASFNYFYPGVPTTGTASVSGHVLGDQDGDGTLDVALVNVRIYLYDSNHNLVASALTDSNGYYSFGNLTAGTYTVTEDQSTVNNLLWNDWTDSVGSLGEVGPHVADSFTVSLGDGLSGANYDFWEVAPVGPPI